MLPAADCKLIQIVDSALADAVQRSGSWLVCRPGCTQCCIGPFPISQLDALRLQAGLTELEQTDPSRAERVRQRARKYVAKLAAQFPGNADTGILEDERQDDFDTFADDEPCPALDPVTGTCDVYAHRPITCREFGPPVRIGAEDDDANDVSAGFSVCELCFQGASPEQVAACEMISDPDALESQLIAELEAEGQRGQTIVAWALR